MKTLVYLAVFTVLLAGGGYYLYQTYGTPTPTTFTTAKVDRGNLDLVIRATGTLEPEEVVDVGAQVTGLIKSFGKDPDHPDKPVDYNSRVTPKMLLAKIDPALYQSQVDVANANLEKANADVLTAQAKLEQANADLKRDKDELPKRAISQADYDAAVANQKTCDAAVALAQSEVHQAKAMLDQAMVNLGYTDIKSPVDGTVIDRRVNIGQTVVANLSAASLFLIAKDLKKMQIWASVNEADMGQIYVDQDVQFTVDAVPDRVFHGKVIQARNNAQMTQNVVTYTVVISVDNSEGKLRPYQTANVQFDAGKHDNVLLVPNLALRWRPQTQQVRPEDREAYAKRQKARQTMQASSTGGATKAPDLKAEKDKRERGTLWVSDGEYVRPVQVKIGASDGAQTEIVAGEVKEGDLVVTGEEHNDVGGGGTTNPFAPPIFKKKG